MEKHFNIINIYVPLSNNFIKFEMCPKSVCWKGLSFVSIIIIYLFFGRAKQSSKGRASDSPTKHEIMCDKYNLISFKRKLLLFGRRLEQWLFVVSIPRESPIVWRYESFELLFWEQ